MGVALAPALASAEFSQPALCLEKKMATRSSVLA